MNTKLLSLLLALMVALACAATDYVTVTGTNVRLRLQPSLQSETLTNSRGENLHPAKGQRLEVLGQAGDFYKVRFNGKQVYISKQFAKSDNAAPAKTTQAKSANGQKYVVVTGEGVRLRLQPSLKAKTLQNKGVNVHPKKGERIKLMGESGDFYKVNFQGNYVFIHKDYAKPE